jgi:hypothetical protein
MFLRSKATAKCAGSKETSPNTNHGVTKNSVLLLISLTASNTSLFLGNHMSLRLIRTLCFGAFLAGLPAIIVSSIRGNNEGWVLTFGMITAIAAIILIAVTATTSTKRIDVFNEIEAERVELRIRQLVEAGANEVEVRALVRDALNLSRGEQ